MIVADRLMGHDSNLVDVGITRGTEHTPGEPDKVDSRGGTEIVSVDYKIADYADVLVKHTGVPDFWVSRNQVPIIWIIHGRPGACFRPEHFGNGNSFTLMSQLARWPRVKAMVTFWEYHVKFWHAIIPKEKLVLFDAPPIDGQRFSRYGKKHDFEALGGKYNIVLADSRREDVDLYEVANGCIEYARNNPGSGARFHFYGMEIPLGPWDLLFAELRSMNSLGEVWSRRPDMEDIYRAAHILVSPQMMATRVIGEALSCGTPVIAEKECRFATWKTDIRNPESVAATIASAVSDLKAFPERIQQEVETSSAELSLEVFGEKMDELYNKVVRK
jgi:glycosyltransferase involved in cell wall biosynthesis